MVWLLEFLYRINRNDTHLHDHSSIDSKTQSESAALLIWMTQWHESPVAVRGVWVASWGNRERRERERACQWLVKRFRKTESDQSILVTKRNWSMECISQHRPHKEGWRRKKPKLPVAHKRAWKDFASKHKRVVTGWMISSSESRFLLHRSDGRVYVRRRLGEGVEGAGAWSRG